MIGLQSTGLLTLEEIRLRGIKNLTLTLFVQFHFSRQKQTGNWKEENVRQLIPPPKFELSQRRICSTKSPRAIFRWAAAEAAFAAFSFRLASSSRAETVFSSSVPIQLSERKEQTKDKDTSPGMNQVMTEGKQPKWEMQYYIIFLASLSTQEGTLLAISSAWKIRSVLIKRKLGYSS